MVGSGTPGPLGECARFGLPRAYRLRDSRDYQRVQRAGKRMPGRRFVAVVLRRSGIPRFGMAVSRKVGNAVVRNRVKRQVREAVRHHRAGIVDLDVVFIALPLAGTSSGVELRAEVAAVLARLRSG